MIHAKNKQELIKHYESGLYTLPININKETIFFITSMLRSDPYERTSAKDLLNHPFLVKNVKDVCIENFVYEMYNFTGVLDKNLGNKEEYNFIERAMEALSITTHMNMILPAILPQSIRWCKTGRRPRHKRWRNMNMIIKIN